MSETKHTPGEWVQGRKKEYGTYSADMIFGPDGGICQVYGIPMNTKVEDVKGTNYEEGMANARLIASAPDLLAALKAIYEQSSDAQFPRLKDIANLAQAAIAKAQGE